MTHRPLESRDVRGWPGHAPEMEEVCSHPTCDVRGRSNLELHHLWARSFLPNQPQNWVRLPEGRVVCNLTFLCRDHHREITENRTRIVYSGGQFVYDEPGWEHTLLSPQPPSTKNYVPEGSKLKSPDEKTSHEIGYDIAPGEKCPTCNRRVNHPKKETSPQTSVVKSWRMPAEEKENREELIESVAAHLGIETSSKFFMDRLILTLCVLALQGPAGDSV